MQSMKDLSKFTDMKFGGIMLLGGVSYKNRTAPESIKEQKEKCIKFAEEIVEKIKKLSEE